MYSPSYTPLTVVSSSSPGENRQRRLLRREDNGDASVYVKFSLYLRATQHRRCHRIVRINFSRYFRLRDQRRHIAINSRTLYFDLAFYVVLILLTADELYMLLLMTRNNREKCVSGVVLWEKFTVQKLRLRCYGMRDDVSEIKPLLIKSLY